MRLEAGRWYYTAPRVLNNDFEPGFYIKHFVKDMHIVQQEMKDKNELQMLNSVCSMYEELEKNGEGNKGTQALLHYYENVK